MINEYSQSAMAAETIAMADQVRGLCSVITKIARSDLEARLKSHKTGISSIEHGVLRHLTHGVTSMAKISRLMGIAPSTLVYIVDGLTEKKLVKRGKDPKDRRREPLLLERKGAELFAKFPKLDSSSTLARSLESMAEARRRNLVALLNELVKALTGSERLYLSAELKDAQQPLAASAKGRIRKDGRVKG